MLSESKCEPSIVLNKFWLKTYFKKSKEVGAWSEMTTDSHWNWQIASFYYPKERKKGSKVVFFCIRITVPLALQTVTYIHLMWETFKVRIWVSCKQKIMYPLMDCTCEITFFGLKYIIQTLYIPRDKNNICIWSCCAISHLNHV